jgi:hypothetical protein
LVAVLNNTLQAVAAYAVANPSAATDIASSGGAMAVTAHVSDGWVVEL